MLQQRASANLSGAFSTESITVPSGAVKQKRVLITGAGGSIGSALAHAVAIHKPAQILLLEASEQALYQIDRDLAVPHKPILASVCDPSALEEIFDRDKPQIVFHAAAFKHVPLMELHPFEALQNNTVGTFILTHTAIRHGSEQVIVVSTDKAVDPASIMGASKRIAELTAVALQSSATRIKAVRLGNVYASQGSAVLLFQEQIAQNKPVTVTHPDATRYFITVEEAAALLLYALNEGLSSSILVPEMKDPVRIDEIAKSLIEQAGSQSQIVYTGLRPGEKLHEQLLSANESFLQGASAPLRPIRSETISVAEAEEAIGELQKAVQERNLSQLLRIVVRLVPSYEPSETLLEHQACAECRV
ncbi:MAG: polysaccharide biosynthesis protein [Silvibacterium sp.]